jgi:hypothetical protein
MGNSHTKPPELLDEWVEVNNPAAVVAAPPAAAIGSWNPVDQEARAFKVQINELFNESFLGKHLYEYWALDPLFRHYNEVSQWLKRDPGYQTPLRVEGITPSILDSMAIRLAAIFSNVDQKTLFFIFLDPARNLSRVSSVCKQLLTNSDLAGIDAENLEKSEAIFRKASYTILNIKKLTRDRKTGIFDISFVSGIILVIEYVEAMSSSESTSVGAGVGSASPPPSPPCPPMAPPPHRAVSRCSQHSCTGRENRYGCCRKCHKPIERTCF